MYHQRHTGSVSPTAKSKPEYVPVDEGHPTVPQDSYAMSKVVNEATARSFQARSGIDKYGLRINNVIEPHEYETKFPAFVADPALRRRNIFAYIDARDLGYMVDCCLRTDGLGYEVFNVSNDDTSVDIPSHEVYRRFYNGVPRRGVMGGFETFYANDKAKTARRLCAQGVVAKRTENIGLRRGPRG